MSRADANTRSGSRLRAVLVVACLLATVLPARAAAPLPAARADTQGVSAVRLQRLHDFMDRATGADV